MKMHMFTVYDLKAAAYITPFFLPTVAQAKRAFNDCVADTNHQFGLHPEDYDLYSLGTYDNESTQFNIFTEPKLVTSGLTVFRDMQKSQGPKSDEN